MGLYQSYLRLPSDSARSQELQSLITVIVNGKPNEGMVLLLGVTCHLLGNTQAMTIADAVANRKERLDGLFRAWQAAQHVLDGK